MLCGQQYKGDCLVYMTMNAIATKALVLLCVNFKSSSCCLLPFISR